MLQSPGPWYIVKFREGTKSGFRQKDLEHEKKESCVLTRGASQVGPVVKDPLVNAGDARNEGSDPGRGRVPRGGNDTPFWYSCLENPTDRGAWRATVHGVAKSQTRLNI